jgi:uncharacterized protein (DUF433 family)
MTTKSIQLNKVITIEAGKRQSKPCIRGMRISVEDVLSWLENGMSIQEILSDFPELTKRDINACSELFEDRKDQEIKATKK